jgi:acetyl-CoA synthetase
MPRRAARFRTSALPALHLRHHRQTERHSAHHRRLRGRHLHHTKWVFDLRDEDIFWCTADIGWVTGHSYVVYGPLQNGATVVMYEGGPRIPQPDRFWEMIDRHKVTVFYTAPTAIRAFMRLGEQWPAKHSMKSLRLLGSVGEPINPEAWMWYRSIIGHDNCPIVDTWWQTETGAIMISPLPGATPTKPGSCTRPLPGIKVEVVTREGKPVPAGSGGYLVIRKPWPSMLRTIYGDPERYQGAVLVADSRALISPATARGRTKTATSG